ncbi:hypothetical protein VTK73DRAFT_3830 [Phialemonium thermophilum]|uniref:Uncharacterized protein n=1 Tax=Phialemonium thermophilum TaxID=223376 RepID=A0ABR3WXA2_9PEZI
MAPTEARLNAATSKLTNLLFRHHKKSLVEEDKQHIVPALPQSSAPQRARSGPGSSSQTCQTGISASGEPLTRADKSYHITHTPDRPRWPVEPSDAPSEEQCLAEITAWHQRAARQSRLPNRQGRVFALAKPGTVQNTSQEYLLKNAMDGDGVGRVLSAGLPSSLKNEDTGNLDDWQTSESSHNNRAEGPSYASEHSSYYSSSTSSSPCSSPQPRSRARVDRRTPPLTTPLSPRPPVPEHGLRSSPKSRLDTSSDHDGDESEIPSYNGEAKEIEQVGISQRYATEAAKPGNCPSCGAYTLDRATRRCGHCRAKSDTATTGAKGQGTGPRRGRPHRQGERAGADTQQYGAEDHHTRQRRPPSPPGHLRSHLIRPAVPKLITQPPSIHKHRATRETDTTGQVKCALDKEGSSSPLTAIYNPLPRLLPTHRSSIGDRPRPAPRPGLQHIDVLDAHRDPGPGRGKAQTLEPDLGPGAHTLAPKFQVGIPSRQRPSQTTRADREWELDLLSLYEDEPPVAQHGGWI